MASDAPAMPAPPRGVASKLEQDGERTTITVPPKGVWRGSFGLIVVGPALMLMGVVSIGRIVASSGGVSPMMLAWFGLLIVVGAGMTLAAQLMGWRSLQITCDPTSVTLVTRTMLGVRRQAFSAGEVDRVVVGEAGFTAGNKPLPRLEIHTQAGGRHVAMTARPEAEVAWAADVIARSLGLASKPVSKG